MVDKPWKQAERRTAEFFRTKRVPLSGSNSGHGTSADMLHEKLYCEIKQGKGWLKLGNLFKKTIDFAKKENKIPVVSIHPKACPELLVFRKKDVESLKLKNGEEYDGKTTD